MAQTGSFAIPLVVMLAIPLTILGVMPGFWLLNVLSAQQVGGFLDPVYFTATGMIGMIALAGIVTRDSIILVDFIHLSLARGRSLFDAIMESRVVRLRPILLTATRRHARRGADHHRPDLLRPGLVADLRPVCLDALHAVRDSGGLLAAVRQQARPRPAAVDDGVESPPHHASGRPRVMTVKRAAAGDLPPSARRFAPGVSRNTSPAGTTLRKNTPLRSNIRTGPSAQYSA